MARKLDPIKEMIAQAVQHCLVTDYLARPPLRSRPDNVLSVEAHAVSPLETQVRVKLQAGGPRYFTVKVSENW